MKLYLTIVAAILTCGLIIGGPWIYKFARNYREERREIEFYKMENAVSELAHQKEGGVDLYINCKEIRGSKQLHTGQEAKARLTKLKEQLEQLPDKTPPP